MSKDLFIIRHAKAELGVGISDFDRPLHQRGISEAGNMADKVVEYNIQPAFLVSSPAKRALGTAQIFAERLQIPIEDIEQDLRIYEGSIETLADIVRGFDNSHDSVALFGHNPDIAGLAYYLGTLRPENFPTCTVVHLHFENAEKWTEVKARSGDTRLFIYP